MRSEATHRVGLLRLGLLLAFALLTIAVGLDWGPIARLDQLVADHAFASTSGHALRTHAWSTLTTGGQPLVLRGLMCLSAALLAFHRRLRPAVWLVALALLEGVVAPAAKLVLSRPRPSWDVPIIVEHSTSFPSGHAAAAATAATAFLLVAGQLIPQVFARRVAEAVVLAAAAGIAVSRIYLGVHYLSDVVGGVLLGSGLALVSFWTAGLAHSRGPAAPSDRHHAAGVHG